jgi:hypothetical protein
MLDTVEFDPVLVSPCTREGSYRNRGKLIKVSTKNELNLAEWLRILTNVSPNLIDFIKEFIR